MATTTSLAEAAPGSAGSAAGMDEALRNRANLKNAQREDPLLGGAVGGARRRAVLGRLAAELEGRGGPERAHALELARAIRPNSVAEAWDGLHVELMRLGEGAMAEAAAGEAREARAEAWRSMRGDADVISQVALMGEQSVSSHASCVNAYRQKLAAMAACSGPLRPGREMEDHVVDMARFGSAAEDWMTMAVIDELYLERGLYEEACAVCERMLGFEGHDRHRMMASTLVEDALGALLAHLERCEDPAYVERMIEGGTPISPRCREGEHLEGLALRCLGLLERRAGDLGLEAGPGAAEGGPLRRAMDYALRVRARMAAPGAARRGRASPRRAA